MKYEDLLACALWANGHDETTIYEMDSQVRETLQNHFERFSEKYANEIEAFCELNGVDDTQVEHSFYLSAAGHGSGFFDFKDGDALHLAASKEHGEIEFMEVY